MTDTITEARPRFWVVPAMWLSALLFAAGFERASDRVADLASEQGWVIRTRPRRRLDRHTGVWTVDRAGQVRTNGAFA